jgi:hypothetical protein
MGMPAWPVEPVGMAVAGLGPEAPSPLHVSDSPAAAHTSAKRQAAVARQAAHQPVSRIERRILCRRLLETRSFHRTDSPRPWSAPFFLFAKLVICWNVKQF